MAAASCSFAITPHRVSICVLLQMYSLPTQSHPPFPFPSVSTHNRLGLFLFSLTKAYDDVLEPKLEHLLSHLNQVGGSLGHWLIENLKSRLSSFSSPDDLFSFFSEIRGVLGGSDSAVMEDNQVILDPNSILGMFLRRCLLAFNFLSFEGVCHLLTNIGMYSKEAVSNCDCEPYELRHSDDSGNDAESAEYENMDLENFVFGKVSEEIEARNQASERVSFHLHAPRGLSGLVDDVDVGGEPRSKQSARHIESCAFIRTSANAFTETDPPDEMFLRTNWQVQGYLMEQADAVERDGSSLSLNAFELILRQIERLAPELHRVHFLRYLNSLFHDDYFAALENLHCYFDYSAGIEGFEFVPPSASSNGSGRYEIALLCLGMMQFHFGHPKQALEVLTEAVRVCQEKSNDSCLAYTLAAICNVLSESDSHKSAGLLGTPYTPMSGMATTLSVKQHLFVLLRGSLKRAQTLKLKRLVASNHLAIAKFDLTHVQRPLLSFGPKTSMKLRTNPINVCKELRSCSHLISEFGSESSTMTIDGALCTGWISTLLKSTGPLLLSESGVENSSSALQVCTQPNLIPRSVLTLLGSSYILRATAWEIYGSAPLARINALVHATCFADSSSSSDAALVHAKLIQHIAVYRGYKEAFAALKVAEEMYLSVSKPVILLLKLQLLHEHSLHRGKLKIAQDVCNELGVLAASIPGVDNELKIEASLRRARTLLAASQFSEAADVAHSLYCMCYKYNKQVENATVLLLIAEIHKKSGNAVLGLPYALASLSFSQSFNLDLLKASAILTIAELWLSLGSHHTKRALTLLHEALPMVLGHGGLELCARARIVEAKCYLSDPGYSVFEDSEIVLDLLKQASDELGMLEYHQLAAEVFYLMAVIYDKLGQLEEREEAATSFKKHILAVDNPQEKDPLLEMF